ncbi:MAG TPA: alpha/beta fold hydrolase, partial [Longimicrobiales bacterium]|nr:alpha/beta fold hydrolase [Longimicrobiales bacterium]
MILSLRRPSTRGVALFLGLSGTAAAVLAGPGAAQDPADLAQQLAAIAAAPVEAGQVAGVAAAVVRGTDTLLFMSHGAADLELGAPLPLDAVFMVGSVTKTVTAAAILQLVDAGRVGLDESLDTYLPDYPLQGRTVTLRNLLNHTSGIPGYTEMTAYRGLQWRSLPRDSLLTLVSGQPFEFEPGTAMSYSNTGYFLLGRVIEAVTGLSYAEVLERNLFGPLGMDRSRYCSDSELMEGRVTGYSRGPDAALRRADPVDHTWPYAAGSVCATVGDLMMFSTALHGGEILSPTGYRAMTHPDTLAGGHALRYGLGLFLETDARGRPMIHHSGAIEGFLSEMRYYPEDDLHVVVLMNTLGVARPEAVATALADRVLGPSSATAARADGERGVPSGTVGEGAERSYAGTYVGRAFGRPMTVTVEDAGDGLIVVERADTVTLGHDRGETFLSPPDRLGTTAIYAFVGDDDPGAELHVDVAGGHFVLRRDDDPLAGLWDSPTPRTTVVELDGHAVRIRTAAPHPHRIPGRPLVVFEAGFGSTLGTWGPFLEQVADLAPVVAYDRAGIGESGWDGVEPTFEHIAGRLRKLLDEIGAEPPFVLVGHSFGGDLVRYFARFHP